MSESNLEKLRQHSRLFQALNTEGCERFVAMSVEREFEVGETLMSEGESGESFLVLDSGRVEILIDEGQKRVAELGSGDCIGEIGAIAMEPRSATVRALEAGKAIVFDAKTSREILADYPKVRELLIKLALKRSEDSLFS